MSGLAVPSGLAGLLAGSEVEPIVAAADHDVVRHRWADGRTAIRKAALPVALPPTGPAGGSDLAAGASLLLDEAARLEWLEGRLPVPEVLGVATDAVSGAVHLVLTELGGTDGADRSQLTRPEVLVAAYAEGLVAVHELAADDCPFRADPALLRARAVARLAHGLVDAASLDRPYRSRSTNDLVALLDALDPAVVGAAAHEPPVVLHGDYSLPNVLVEGGRVVGYLDVGRLGVGDRYLDLADAARSLVRNLGPEATAPFFEAYGLPSPSLVRLEHHVLLSQLT